jgi:flagellin-like protein
MKTLRKIRKNSKALSPVVASIILIAVTVAVSIAVAAWMGALTVGFMDTNTVTITSATFTDDGGSPAADIIQLAVKNTGTSAVTLATGKVNGATCTIAAASDLTIADGGTDTITLSGANADWTAGNTYKMDLYDASGQLVGSYQAVAV